jgi:hypothetical protein
METPERLEEREEVTTPDPMIAERNRRIADALMPRIPTTRGWARSRRDVAESELMRLGAPPLATGSLAWSG